MLGPLRSFLIMTSERICRRQVYMVRVTNAAAEIVCSKCADLGPDRKLRSYLVDRIESKRQVTHSPIPRRQAYKIAVFRIVEAERAIEAQSFFQDIRCERKLRPAAVGADRPNASADKCGALLISKVGIVRLKNSGLKTAQVSAEECFAG